MGQFDHLMHGWNYNEYNAKKVQDKLRIPVVSDVYSPIKDSGKGKKRLLYKYVSDLLGSFHTQVQEVSDCTSFAYAHCTNTLKAIQATLNPTDEFDESLFTSTEDAYSGSRTLPLAGNNQINGEGSCGSFIAMYASKYGTLCRKKYGNIDLSKYSGNRANQWGQPNGYPTELLQYAKEHIIHTASQVNGYSQARDLLWQLFPVMICSNRGFSNVRTKNGICLPEGTWNHALALLAYDEETDPNRPVGLICNSWPKEYISGPQRFGACS